MCYANGTSTRSITMFKLHFLSAALLLSAGLFLASCEKDEDPKQPVEAVTLDILVGADASTGEFTLFSFEKGEVVASSEQSTNGWDFGLLLTTFIVNSGVSGPGEGGAIVLNGIFDDIKEAPADGYRTDATGDLAIVDGEWYDYNPVARTFSPKAGNVFLFRTGDGKYAKMELLKADPTDDNGNVVTPPTRPTKIKYTLRFVYQPDGSRNF